MFNTFSNKIIFKRKKVLRLYLLEIRNNYQIIGFIIKAGTRWEYGDPVCKARLWETLQRQMSQSFNKIALREKTTYWVKKI